MRKNKSKKEDINKEAEKLDKVRTFKGLIKRLYRAFPNGQVSERVIKRFVIMENVGDSLVDKGFFIREPVSNEKRDKYLYSLGPNAFHLVSSWKMEKLTWWIVGLTMVSLSLIIIQTF